MDNLEKHIYEHKIKEVAHYFSELLNKKRADNKVPVLVESFILSFFFADCDTYGYPIRRVTDYIDIGSLDSEVLNDGDQPSCADTATYYKKRIEIIRPLILYRPGYDLYHGKPYVFLWEGKLLEDKKIPVSELNVVSLLKLAQKAVKDREGIIIDEVLKNKLISRS